MYTSSFFGDELWPADQLGFVNSAIKACPNEVVFEVARGEANVSTKRLPKKPAPKRFGRKLSAAQAALATHICLDCGFVYTSKIPFETLPGTYECPQCGAPKVISDAGPERPGVALVRYAPVDLNASSLLCIFTSDPYKCIHLFLSGCIAVSFRAVRPGDRQGKGGDHLDPCACAGYWHLRGCCVGRFPVHRPVLICACQLGSGRSGATGRWDPNRLLFDRPPRPGSI